MQVDESLSASKKKQKLHPPTPFDLYFESRMRQERESNAQFQKILEELQNNSPLLHLLPQKSNKRERERIKSPTRKSVTLETIKDEIENAKKGNLVLANILSQMDVDM